MANKTPEERADAALEKAKTIQTAKQPGVIQTPEMMFACEDIKTLKSTVKDFEKYCELFVEREETSVASQSTGSTHLTVSAAIHNNGVVVVIPNGPHAPEIETSMHDGKNLSNMKIIDISNINGKNVVTQERSYGNCRITYVKKDSNFLVLIFRPSSRKNTVTPYKQDGTKEGNSVSEIDYTTAVGK